MFSAKPKTPRPTGKAGRYESGQKDYSPSGNSPKRVFDSVRRGLKAPSEIGFTR